MASLDRMSIYLKREYGPLLYVSFLKSNMFPRGITHFILFGRIVLSLVIVLSNLVPKSCAILHSTSAKEGD